MKATERSGKSIVLLKAPIVILNAERPAALAAAVKPGKGWFSAVPTTAVLDRQLVRRAGAATATTASRAGPPAAS